jgi:hypothetical protein
MGPAKCGPISEKQSDGKDGKKKGDKSATANPAFKDGLKPVCQICGMEHEALQCPKFETMLKQCAAKRGELFPSLSDKDGKGKGAKTEAHDENREKFCRVCARLKLSEFVVRNHNSKNCRKFGKLLDQLEVEDGNGSVSPVQYRKENQRMNPQIFDVSQSPYSSSSRMLNPYPEFLPPGP